MSASSPSSSRRRIPGTGYEALPEDERVALLLEELQYAAAC